MKTCKDCKYAEWQKAKNGHLHPNGNGQCNFKIAKLVLPNCAGQTDQTTLSNRVQSINRFIDRFNTYKTDCPCYAKTST